MIAAAPSALVAAGVEIGRDQAREDALRELTDGRYAVDDPSLIERGLTWLGGRITDLLERAASVTPGGLVGFLLILALVVGLLVALWFGGRSALRERSARSSTSPLFDERRRLTAAEHRRAAEEASGTGDLSTAVLEWFRAGVRGLEERGLLDQRPGRTADEAATEIGALFPDLVPQALSAARRFDAVAFGRVDASADDEAAARAFEEQVRRSTPALVPA